MPLKGVSNKHPSTIYALARGQASELWKQTNYRQVSVIVQKIAGLFLLRAFGEVIFNFHSHLYTPHVQNARVQTGVTKPDQMHQSENVNVFVRAHSVWKIGAGFVVNELWSCVCTKGLSCQKQVFSSIFVGWFFGAVTSKFFSSVFTGRPILTFWCKAATSCVEQLKFYSFRLSQFWGSPVQWGGQTENFEVLLTIVQVLGKNCVRRCNSPYEKWNRKVRLDLQQCSSPPPPGTWSRPIIAAGLGITSHFALVSMQVGPNGLNMANKWQTSGAQGKIYWSLGLAVIWTAAHFGCFLALFIGPLCPPIIWMTTDPECLDWFTRSKHQNDHLHNTFFTLSRKSRKTKWLWPPTHPKQAK